MEETFNLEIDWTGRIKGIRIFYIEYAGTPKLTYKAPEDYAARFWTKYWDDKPTLSELVSIIKNTKNPTRYAIFVGNDGIPYLYEKNRFEGP